MNAHYFGRGCFQLGLAIVVCVLVAGCGLQPFSKSNRSAGLSEVEGKWFWQQIPWHGYFVLQKSGDSYSGTLDDVFEGTYGDRIKDVNISDGHIAFTRDGSFGLQYWKGTLKVEDGRLKIVDGRWRKSSGISGSFYAERVTDSEAPRKIKGPDGPPIAGFRGSGLKTRSWLCKFVTAEKVMDLAHYGSLLG